MTKWGQTPCSCGFPTTRKWGLTPFAGKSAACSAGCGRADRRVIGETDRLTLRPLRDDDAPFILTLLNDPSFVEFVGDKGVRTIEDAREYIRTGARDGYMRRALFLASRKADGAPVGM